MEIFFESLLSGILSGSVVATVLTLVFKRKTERIAAEIKSQFEKNMTIFKLSYQWKEKAVSELLGQICLQFNRTKRGFKRYKTTDLYLEAKVLKEGNERIRNLLLEKAHLIPNELIEDAINLIEHYDVWLEEFYKQRDSKNPNLDQTFIYAGPKGFRFPSEPEEHFKKKYRELWNELHS